MTRGKSKLYLTEGCRVLSEGNAVLKEHKKGEVLKGLRPQEGSAPDDSLTLERRRNFPNERHE